MCAAGSIRLSYLSRGGPASRHFTPFLFTRGGFGFRVSCLGSRVSSLGFRVSSLGFWVSSLGCGVPGLGFWVGKPPSRLGSGPVVHSGRFWVRVLGFGFWFFVVVWVCCCMVQDSRFRVPDSGRQTSIASRLWPCCSLGEVLGLGLGFVFRVSSLGFRFSGFRVSGSWFRV
jgi:hypothetical protein